jgi:hypothetical protein
MRMLLFAGLLLIVLGITSLFVPIPQTERHGIDAGDLHVGVKTTHNERVPPAISAVLIIGGVVMCAVGARAR